MFEAHAAHLYDYCTSQLADQQEAADATQATLITAYTLIGRLKDADRLRAWLFALARRECTSEQPVRAALPRLAWDVPDPVREPDTEEVRLRLSEEHAAQRAAAAALAALPESEREVLDLVYRHYVSPAELPAILGLPATRAQALLAAAVKNFEGSEPGGELKVTVVSAIPLASLPPSVRRRTASVVLDPELASYRDSLAGSAGALGADGFPPQEALAQTPPRKKLVLASALLAALLLAPAVAGAILFSYFGGSPHAITHAISEVIGSAPSSSASVAPASGPTPHLPSYALFPRKKKAKGGVLPYVPAPGRTAPPPRPRPHPSASKSHHPAPSPTSRISPSASPFPSPSSSAPSPTPTPTSTTT